MRLSAASPQTGRVVEIAAVAGQHIDHDVLADVCALPENELDTSLREAVEAQLLVVDSDETVERYRFRHALAQEAAYEQLLPSERRRFHAAYAEAMGRRPSLAGGAEASRLVEIAHHWNAAHQPGPRADGRDRRRLTRRGQCSPTPRPPASTSTRPTRGISCRPRTARRTATSATCSERRATSRC